MTSIAANELSPWQQLALKPGVQRILDMDRDLLVRMHGLQRPALDKVMKVATALSGAFVSHAHDGLPQQRVTVVDHTSGVAIEASLVYQGGRRLRAFCRRATVAEVRRAEALEQLRDAEEKTDYALLHGRIVAARARGVEARRLERPWDFDPFAGLRGASVDPLPHQLDAVYDRMLGRRPLRFLLADDPGAGKTIMAGLLIRERLLRGSVRRCLVTCALLLEWILMLIAAPLGHVLVPRV